MYKVLFAPGGVARNVAECIFKLGVRPFMIGTLGIDGPGLFIIVSLLFNILISLSWELNIIRLAFITQPMYC